jgi:hypothetical protein
VKRIVHKAVDHHIVENHCRDAIIAQLHGQIVANETSATNEKHPRGAQLIGYRCEWNVAHGTPT